MFRSADEALEYLSRIGQDYLTQLPEAARQATQVAAQEALNRVNHELGALRANQRPSPRAPKAQGPQA